MKTIRYRRYKQRIFYAKQHHPRQDGAVVFCSFRYTTERLLHFADHTAGYLLSGIAGRLGAEVIGITVYDHSPSNNIRHRKPIRSHGQIRIPLTLQQWRQVACVFRMCLVIGIIVATCAGKVSSGRRQGTVQCPTIFPVISL